MSADEPLPGDADGSVTSTEPDGAPASGVNPGEALDTAASDELPAAVEGAVEEASAVDEVPAAAETSVEAPPAEEETPAEEASQVEETPAAAFRYEEKYYAPVSPEAPTGIEVEFYHFSEMEQALAWPLNDFGRPDQAKRPNFRAVRETALSFLNGTKEIKATRDVRPMLALVIAEAGDKGPVGLAKALDLFVTIATTQWDSLHPQKEDEDDDELMTRMEEIRKYLNPSVFSLAVESIGIARSPRVGDLTTRTFGIAMTKVSPREGEFAPNAEALTSMLAEEDDARASVLEAHEAYQYAIAQLDTFGAFLGEQPDLDPVDVAAISEALAKQAAYIEPFVAAPEVSAGADGADFDVSGQSSGAFGSATTAPISGPVTLAEAMELVDDVLTFYARSGRSSPVPLGLISLRDLMAGDFNTWINQTASSGLSEAAINLSTVDASRLSTFADGSAPAAVAPAAAVDLDFSKIDGSINAARGAFAALDNAVYQLQQTLPPAEGEEENSALAAEVAEISSALDKILEAKQELESGAQSSGVESSDVDNTSEGDVRHSRITDRNGVKSALDAVAAFFEREEPSSPAPAYLRRLRSLVDARFTEIARELMPDDGGEAKLRLEPKTNLR